MSYDTVSFQASDKLAQEVNATQSRSLGKETADIFACFARKGGYAGNWTWSNRSTTLRAVESFAKRGLAVKQVRELSGGKTQTVYKLRDDLQSRLMELEAEVQAERKAREDDNQAKRDAVESQRRFVVFIVNVYDGTPKRSGDIFTGSPDSRELAHARAAEWRTSPAGQAGAEIAVVVELPNS